MRLVLRRVLVALMLSVLTRGAALLRTPTGRPRWPCRPTRPRPARSPGSDLATSVSPGLEPPPTPVGQVAVATVDGLTGAPNCHGEISRVRRGGRAGARPDEAPAPRPLLSSGVPSTWMPLVP